MATRTTRTLSVQLRLVATEETFEETEPASLPGMPVTIDTTAEPADEPRPLAKCSGDYFPWSRSKAGGR